MIEFLYPTTSRAALARDAYSYLHLPMVAGIVLFALRLKVTPRPTWKIRYRSSQRSAFAGGSPSTCLHTSR
jgi:hypothetical protein